MNKRVILGTILIILSISLVLAAGSSTRDSNKTNSPPINKTDCESKDTTRERIKCRFENPSKGYAYGLEEACRGHPKQEACERLYNRSKSCYDINDSLQKKGCFLRESGVNFNAGGTFRAAPKEAKANYVVLLLYELQERIEGMQKDGKITTDQATSLVEKIVEIKRMILAGEPRSEIIVKINEFKREYRSVVLGIGGSRNTNSTIKTNATGGDITNITGNSS